MILMRLLHIGGAIFWAGGVLFINTQLGPAVAAIGPQGFPVMLELERRNYFGRLMFAATITVLSGLYMVWQDSSGFVGAWFQTRFGMGISIGMIAAILAYVGAILLLRPAMLRVNAVAGQLAQAGAADRDALQAEFVTARDRLMRTGATLMVLLLVAIIAMAIARYL